MKKLFPCIAIFVLIAATSTFSGILIQGSISKVRVYSSSSFTIEFKSNFTTSCPTNPTLSYSCNAVAVTGDEGYVKNMLAVALSSQSTGLQFFAFVDNVGTTFTTNGTSFLNVLDGGQVAP